MPLTAELAAQQVQVIKIFEVSPGWTNLIKPHFSHIGTPSVHSGPDSWHRQRATSKRTEPEQSVSHRETGAGRQIERRPAEVEESLQTESERCCPGGESHSPGAGQGPGYPNDSQRTTHSGISDTKCCFSVFIYLYLTSHPLRLAMPATRRSFGAELWWRCWTCPPRRCRCLWANWTNGFHRCVAPCRPRARTSPNPVIWWRRWSRVWRTTKRIGSWPKSSRSFRSRTSTKWTTSMRSRRTDTSWASVASFRCRWCDRIPRRTGRLSSRRERWVSNLGVFFFFLLCMLNY